MPDDAHDSQSLANALDALDRAPHLRAVVAWAPPAVDGRELGEAVRRLIGPAYPVRHASGSDPRGCWWAAITSPREEDLAESDHARVDRVCRIGVAAARGLPGLAPAMAALPIARGSTAWQGWRGWLAAIAAIHADPKHHASIARAGGVRVVSADVDDEAAREAAKARWADDWTLDRFRSEVVAELAERRAAHGAGPSERTATILLVDDFTAASRAVADALHRRVYTTHQDGDIQAHPTSDEVVASASSRRDHSESALLK